MKYESNRRTVVVTGTGAELAELVDRLDARFSGYEPDSETVQTIEYQGNKAERSAIKNYIDRKNQDLLRSRTADANGTLGAPKRVLVESGKYRIGDRYGDWTIISLGQSWRPREGNYDDMAASGVHPSATAIQYAYFS